MATVDFFSAFEYEWAETGSVFDWDDAQYKLGWATVGSTPPTVEQFNRVLQVADEKSNWLYGQLKTVADAKSVTLSAGSLTGLQQVLAAYTPAASETVAGIAEIATQAEVTAGTDDARIVTPLKLATAVPAASTTAVGKLRLATTAEAEALTNDTAALTPKKLSDAFKGANSTLAATGFIRYPNGMIEQWCPRTHTVGPAGNLTMSFPFAFPNAVFSAHVQENSQISAGAVVWSVSGLSVGGATTFWNYSNVTGGTVNRAVFLRAIGN